MVLELTKLSFCKGHDGFQIIDNIQVSERSLKKNMYNQIVKNNRNLRPTIFFLFFKSIFLFQDYFNPSLEVAV